MNKLKQQASCLAACAAVLLAPLVARGTEGAPAEPASDGSEAPQTGSVLMLAAGLMVAGCMRRRDHGGGEFGE